MSDPSSPASKNVAAAKSASALGQYSLAETLLRQAIKKDPKSRQAWGPLVNILILADKPEDAIVAGETYVRLFPDHWKAALSLGKAYFKAGAYAQALTIINRAGAGCLQEGADDTNITVWQVRCLEALGDDATLLDTADSFLAGRFNDYILKTGVRIAHRRNDKARLDHYLGQLTKVRRTQLPETLAAGLASEANIKPTHITPAIELAWQLAGQPETAREAWFAAQARGVRDGLLLRHWLEYAPASRQDEIGALIRSPDLQILHDVLTHKDTPGLIVGSHLGPVAALNYTLRQFPKPPIDVGISLDTHTPAPIVNTVNGDRQSLRRLYQHLRAGNTLTFGADIITAPSRFDAPVMYHGHAFWFSATPARLAYRSGARVFWVVPLWRDGMIDIEADHLPSPHTDETLSDYTHRWRTAYAKKVLSALEAPPENISLRPAWASRS